MRHLAWLHAVPEGHKKSRLSTLRDAGDEESSFLKFPDLQGAEYLVSLLNEVGLAESNGMGAVPITWREFESWLNCTQADLSVWEITTLREMSEAYVSEFSQASEKTRAAPYTYVNEEEVAVERQKVDRKWRDLAAAFKKRKPAS